MAEEGVEGASKVEESANESGGGGGGGREVGTREIGNEERKGGVRE